MGQRHCRAKLSSMESAHGGECWLCETWQRAETVDECPPHKNQLARPPHHFSGSRGSRVNNNSEDGQQFATRTAVAFVNGTETANTTRSLGVTAAAFEAEACLLGALVSEICPAQDHLNHNPIHNITILSTNLVAIQAMMVGSDVWGGEVECPRRSGNLKGVDVGFVGEVGRLRERGG